MSRGTRTMVATLKGLPKQRHGRRCASSSLRARSSWTSRRLHRVRSRCFDDLGALYCIDPSRLARHGGWDHLIDLSALTGALLVDPSGISSHPTDIQSVHLPYELEEGVAIRLNYERQFLFEYKTF